MSTPNFDIAPKQTPWTAIVLVASLAVFLLAGCVGATRFPSDDASSNDDALGHLDDSTTDTSTIGDLLDGSDSSSGSDTPVADTVGPSAPPIGSVLTCGKTGPAGGLAAGTDLMRHDIDQAVFPKARCNDGTAAFFYFRPYQGAENRNRWVIQLQGGGSCSTPQDCANRWCSKDTSFGMQGMSANASPTVGINGRGILARPRTDNPLAGFNHVFVRYCSSDQWSGTRGPVTVEVDDPAGKLGKVKLTLYFNGHDIIEAVLRTLRRDGVAPLSYDDGQSQSEMPDLDDATQVLFAGGSGGGAGVIHNLDHVGTLLRQSNTNCQGSSCALAYAGLVDSITGPYRWNLDYSTTTLCTAPELQVCDYEAHIRLQNEAGSTFLWGAINDDSCNPWHQAHDPQNEWRCGDKDHILRHHLTTPFFVRMGLQDSNLTSGYSDVHYTVPGQGLLDEALFGALVRQQLLELPSIAQTAEEKDAITRAPGAFGPACARHVTIDDNPSTYGVTLSDGNDDYTMFQLMGNWLKGTQPQVLVAPDLDQSSCP